MLSFVIIILCVNLDALSFGISYGLRKQKIKFSSIIFISTLSTILFLIPLYLSNYIFNKLNQKLCYILNGIFLINLGIFYIFETHKNSCKKLTIRNQILECFIISIDAIITALFYGYLIKNHIFYILFYYFINFFAIFSGDRIFYKFSNFSRLNFSFFSGFIFIFLGILKIFGI